MLHGDAATGQSRVAAAAIALVPFVVATATVVSNVGCRKDAENAGAATALPRTADAGGSRTCVASDAPPRTLSDARTPAAAVAAMVAVADWQLANPATRWPTTEWTYAPFWIGLSKLASIVADRKYHLAVQASAETDRKMGLASSPSGIRTPKRSSTLMAS